jgi:hypothetical protein
MQAILELRRQNLKIRWHGTDREVPLPAGVAVNSPWMDITLSSPSCTANVPYDYLPVLETISQDHARRPACAAWPAAPPRHMMYADDHLLLHPLVTLLSAPSWAGAPPTYICTGWELLADEDKYVASRLAADGVSVVFEEYEAMPHCFALLFGHLPGARRCMDGWAGFMRRAVEAPGSIATRFVTVRAKGLEEVPREPAKVMPYDQETMRRRLLARCNIDAASAWEATPKL